MDKRFLLIGWVDPEITPTASQTLLLYNINIYVPSASRPYSTFFIKKNSVV